MPRFKLLFLLLLAMGLIQIPARANLGDDSDFGDKTLSYDDYKVLIKNEPSECGTTMDDQPGTAGYGPYRYSCRITRIVHLSDGVWRKLEALACRHGPTDTHARAHADGAAAQILFQNEIKGPALLGYPDEHFTKDRERHHCVLVESPSPDENGEDQTGGGDQTPPPTPPPRVGHPNRADFTFNSHDKYQLALRFFSQMDNGTWPGIHSHWELNGRGTYSLSCTPGEKICYGAWRLYQDRDWGVGRYGINNCEHCCVQCGGETTIDLNSGGSDAGPPPAVFIFHDLDRYNLSTAFYSQSRHVVWPSSNQHWTFHGTQTFRLNCQQGEKICFGAWREYQTYYWGVGHGDKGCQNCCTTCGGLVEMTFRDAGPNSFPQSRPAAPPPQVSSGGSDSYDNSDSSADNDSSVSDLIGTLSDLTSIAAGVAAAGGGGSSVPTYRPRPGGSQSTITGHSR